MSENALTVGVDVGATLAKIALADPGEDGTGFELLPSAKLERVAAHVTALGPVLVGLTGGGAVVGLGGALTGAGFKDLCTLAERGDAAGVDLRISDIYGQGELPLAQDLTAANFGKLARETGNGSGLGEPDEQGRADRAAGVMRLVGETVALICAGLSAATGARVVVYGGSTLRDNPCLVNVLTEVTTLCGLQSCLLPHGGFAGALGALELARSGAGRGT